MAVQSRFSQRKDSPFTHDLYTFIVLKYGELANVTLVLRAFKKKYFPKNPRKASKLEMIRN